MFLDLKERLVEEPAPVHGPNKGKKGRPSFGRTASMHFASRQALVKAAKASFAENCAELTKAGRRSCEHEGCPSKSSYGASGASVLLTNKCYASITRYCCHR